MSEHENDEENYTEPGLSWKNTLTTSRNQTSKNTGRENKEQRCPGPCSID